MKTIGQIHLGALPGYPQFTSMKQVIEDAVQDAKMLEQGGVDAIMVENTDDDPHTILVGKEVVSALTAVLLAVKKVVNVPLGVCVLWNDYEAGFALAKTCRLSFVRVPVFIEVAVTPCGMIEGRPYDVVAYRHKLGLDDVGIFADVQVKHAGHLAPRPIGESAAQALDYGADQVIVTGKYTGNAPLLDDLREVRKACPRAKILVGSGADPSNAKELGKYADTAIVGTCLKTKGRIDLKKVKQYVQVAKS